MKTKRPLKTVLTIASVLFVVFVLYSIYIPVVYHYVPRLQAVIEHVTHYPPRLCRVLNVKALHGSGELRWAIVLNKKTGKTVEHVWVYKNGAAMDLACPADTCEETTPCGSIAVENYRVVSGAASGQCRTDNYDLKRRVFLEYLDAALQVDKFLDHI